MSLIERTYSCNVAEVEHEGVLYLFASQFVIDRETWPHSRKKCQGQDQAVVLETGERVAQALVETIRLEGKRRTPWRTTEQLLPYRDEEATFDFSAFDVRTLWQEGVPS